MAQEYEQPVDSSPPSRTQRMTADESRAVIALWQQERVEQTGLTDKPALPDVAEGLDVSVEDVQRLLMEVRARRLEEERALAAEQELAQAERRLAEEQEGLAATRRQRAELRRQAEEDAWRNAPLWQPPQDAPRLRRSKPRQPALVEWAGAEDFWQRTEEDVEFGKQHRAARLRKNSRYVLVAAMLLPVFLAVLSLLLSLLGMKP